MKISYKIPLLASTIVMLAFYIFSSTQYYKVRSSLYQNVESKVEEVSTALSYQITNWLNGKLALIDLMAETINANFSLDSIQQTINNPSLEKEFILVFGALDTDGKPISNTPSWEPGDNWDARLRPWYPHARAHKRALLTEPYADSATKDILISAVANLYDKGSFKGAFGGDINLSTVSNVVNTVNFNNMGYAFLLNAQGDIISHPNANLNGQHINTLFNNTLPLLNSELQETTINNQPVLAYFRPLDQLYGSKWLIGIVLEKNKVMASANALKDNAIISALVAALLSSLILYIAMRQLLIKPLDKITSIADEMSRGKLSAHMEETHRTDEIGVLAKSIARLDFSLKMTLNKLHKK